MLPMLSLAAGGGPVREGFQSVAIFPAELEKFASVEVGGFLAEEGFKAPLDVRALPRTKTVAAGSEPIELEHVPQATQVYGISFPLFVVSGLFSVKRGDELTREAENTSN